MQIQQKESIPIGRNRVRGRPSSTKGALEYQPCEEQGVFSADSDNENEQQEKSIKKKEEKRRKNKKILLMKVKKAILIYLTQM